MSRTFRRVPPVEYRDGFNPQVKSWIGLGYTYGKHEGRYGRILNGWDTRPKSYLHPSWNCGQTKGYGEDYRSSSNRRRLKRVKSKHVRQYWKTIIERWED